MRETISAVAFDIDGTLYSNGRFYFTILPYFLKNIRFFLKFNEVRKILHKTAPLADFYGYQAVLLAEKLDISNEKASELIQKYAYDGLVPYFEKVKPFAHVMETFQAFRKAGLKIGFLSDFPPSQKGNLWGLRNLSDVVLGSEECGALKPSKYPFGILAQALDVPFERILYVGNSISADVRGAKAVGMKTAYIMPFWRKLLNLPLREADISFKNYCQLKDFVLH